MNLLEEKINPHLACAVNGGKFGLSVSQSRTSFSLVKSINNAFAVWNYVHLSTFQRASVSTHQNPTLTVLPPVSLAVLAQSTRKAWKTLTGVGVSGGSAVWSAEGESSTGLALTHHPQDPMEQTAKEKPSKHATPKTVLLQVYQFSHSFIES